MMRVNHEDRLLYRENPDLGLLMVDADAIITAAADDRVEEVVMGMAHRGRLNVLANFMSKPFQAIFSEFEGGARSEERFSRNAETGV